MLWLLYSPLMSPKARVPPYDMEWLARLCPRPLDVSGGIRAHHGRGGDLCANERLRIFVI